MYVSEVAGMRAFGSESELMVVMTEYAERMGDVRDDMDLTHEFHRLGALQGKLLDADGTSVLYDYFDEFGIPEPVAIDFELGTANTKVRLKCAEVKRKMVRSAKGALTNSTRIHALCGDDWYDKLIEHDSVKRTYENWAAAADLREDRTFESFPFAGIVFHNYRGTDDNSEVAIPVDEAKFFPVGARGVFKKYMSPANEFAPFVNTKGQDTYALNVEDKDRQSWVKGELLFLSTLHVRPPGSAAESNLSQAAETSPKTAPDLRGRFCLRQEISMKYKVTHKGEIAQVVKVAGGTLTIKPGTTNKVVDTEKPLTEERLEHYKARGVVFKSATTKAALKKLEAAVEAAQKAYSDAENDEDRASALNELAEAEQALADAQS